MSFFILWLQILGVDVVVMGERVNAIWYFMVVVCAFQPV